MGLTGKETVVVYESKFGMRAARVGWMLEYAGARKVFLLEGGFQAWHKSHLPTEKRFERPDHRKFRVSPVSKLVATADEIRSARSTKILAESLVLNGLSGQTSSRMEGDSRQSRKWLVL